MRILIILLFFSSSILAQDANSLFEQASVSYEQKDPYQYLKDLDIELGQFLHANQEYTYFSPVCAGDRIKMESKLSDLFDKRGGRLQFLVFRSTYTNQDKVIVAKSKTTLVVR